MNVEIHLLQNFAPSCLNRDDTGQPKQCEFGGVTRARISSQCFKRAVRDTDPFATLLEEKGGSVRTRMLIVEIARHIDGKPEGERPSDDTVDLVADVFKEAGLERPSRRRARPGAQEEAAEGEQALQEIAEDGDGVDQEGEEERDVTKVIVYMDRAAIREMASAFRDNRTTLKGDKERRKGTIERLAELLADAVRTPDIAMFGRMIEVKDSTPIGKRQLRVDGALYPAHPLSTHGTDYETDFFTAVDDISGQTGAGMMGHAGYNSACYYRYACVNFDQLVVNLKGDRELAERTLEAFLEAFVRAIPGAKKTSMAAFNAPDLALFVVRSGGVPVSLANAFAAPVSAWGRSEFADLIGNSARALTRYWERHVKVYGDAGVINTHLCQLLEPQLLDENGPNVLGTLHRSDRGSLREAVRLTLQDVSDAADGRGAVEARAGAAREAV
jgi:CRISPR system Cascade subunit CasC